VQQQCSSSAAASLQNFNRYSSNEAEKIFERRQIKMKNLLKRSVTPIFWMLQGASLLILLQNFDLLVEFYQVTQQQTQDFWQK
jgi:hypothetical protein